MRIPILISFIFLASWVYAQTSTGFTSTARTVSSQYIGAGEYSITVTDFRSSQTMYDQFDLAIGQLIWAESRRPDMPCNNYVIKQITYEINGDITFLATGDNIVGSTNRPRDSDVVAIVATTSINKLSLFKASQISLTGYISPNLQECILNDVIISIDDIGGGVIDTLYFQQSQDTIFEFVVEYVDGTVARDTVNLVIDVNAATVNADDVTITGDGSASNPLTADTTIVLATKAFVQNQIKGFSSYTYIVGIDLTVGANVISLPFTPTDLSNLFIERNGVTLYVNVGFSLVFNVNGSVDMIFNNYDFIENEIIKIYHFD